MNEKYIATYLQLKTKRAIRIVADGNCMEPIIRNKDVVEIVAFDRYKVGDIVLVSNNKQMKIHRIISKDDEGYITKGDHSYLPDRRKNSVILGKATQNCTLGQVIHINSKRAYLRASISRWCGNLYRSYLKSSSMWRRGTCYVFHKIGNVLLFYI